MPKIDPAKLSDNGHWLLAKLIGGHRAAWDNFETEHQFEVIIKIGSAEIPFAELVAAVDEAEKQGYARGQRDAREELHEAVTSLGEVVKLWERLTGVTRETVDIYNAGYEGGYKDGRDR